MMYGPYVGYGWGTGSMMGWFGGGIVMIAFWVAFVWLIVSIAREVRGKNISHDMRTLQLLKERYAKGEITKEEFDSMKRDVAE